MSYRAIVVVTEDGVNAVYLVPEIECIVAADDFRETELKAQEAGVRVHNVIPKVVKNYRELAKEFGIDFNGEIEIANDQDR